MIEVDRHINSRYVAEKLEIERKTVIKHLHKTKLNKKLDVWVPHQMTRKNMMGIEFSSANRVKSTHFLIRFDWQQEMGNIRQQWAKTIMIVSAMKQLKR